MSASDYDHHDLDMSDVYADAQRMNDAIGASDYDELLAIMCADDRLDSYVASMQGSGFYLGVDVRGKAQLENWGTHLLVWTPNHNAWGDDLWVIVDYTSDSDVDGQHIYLRRDATAQQVYELVVKLLL